MIRTLLRYSNLLAMHRKTRIGKLFIKIQFNKIYRYNKLPLEMIPYSFGGESVNENAIVALPRSLTEMLFGLSRSG